MSAGPIHVARQAHVAAPATTPAGKRVCMVGARGHGYCGRKAKPADVALDWANTTCSECHAARIADEEASR